MKKPRVSQIKLIYSDTPWVVQLSQWGFEFFPSWEEAMKLAIAVTEDAHAIISL